MRVQTKATNKVKTSAPGRTATKLAATLTNGPALLGYARVSTSDQDTHIQQAKLRDAGCAVIRAEKASGKARESRSELEVVMSFVRPGDTLVVVKLDRLGRSTSRPILWNRSYARDSSKIAERL
jgi:DNA invertase Pin-like site-specific DNA recombinase